MFRNLRERFGIDDQDYQVWSCLGTAGGFRDVGVRKPQDRQGAEGQLSLGYCISLSKLTPSASRSETVSLRGCSCPGEGEGEQRETAL